MLVGTCFEVTGTGFASRYQLQLRPRLKKAEVRGRASGRGDTGRRIDPSR